MSFTPSAETAIAYARAYNSAGISVLPLRKRDKRPAIPWKALQERPQSPEDLENLFKDSEGNIGALCGSISDGLLVLDHDDPERATQLHKAPIYQHLMENAPVDKTRRGWHVWVKVNEIVASSKNARYGVDVLAEGKYCVAPPSIVEHKAYGKDQLYLFTDRGKFPPLTLDEEQTRDLFDLYGLQALPEKLFDQGGENATSSPYEGIAGNSQGFYGLGKSIWHRLKHPLPKGRRSEDEAGIVYRCVGIGWSFPQVFELFRKHAGAGSKFREKLAEGFGEQYLQQLYRTAEAVIFQSMSPLARRINDALAALQVYNPFAGRGAATDREVLRTLLQIAREVNSLAVQPGIRKIASLAGLETLSVRRSLDRLEEQQYIKRSIVNLPEQGFNVVVTHILYMVPRIGELRDSQEEGAPKIVKKVLVNHDAYRVKALGKEGPELLFWLRSVAPLPFTRADAPVSAMYARRVFPKLVEAGILREAEVMRTPTRGRPSIQYVLTSKLQYSDLDKIAEVFGTAGAGKAQQLRDQRERESYAALRRGPLETK